jgi:hypothetical protein
MSLELRAKNLKMNMACMNAVAGNLIVHEEYNLSYSEYVKHGVLAKTKYSSDTLHHSVMAPYLSTRTTESELQETHPNKHLEKFIRMDQYQLHACLTTVRGEEIAG